MSLGAAPAHVRSPEALHLANQCPAKSPSNSRINAKRSIAVLIAVPLTMNVLHQSRPTGKPWTLHSSKTQKKRSMASQSSLLRQPGDPTSRECDRNTDSELQYNQPLLPRISRLTKPSNLKLANQPKTPGLL